MPQMLQQLPQFLVSTLTIAAVLFVFVVAVCALSAGANLANCWLNTGAGRDAARVADDVPAQA